MKYLFLAAMMPLALSGCANEKASYNGWMAECERNFSYDGRELSRCKERVEEPALVSAPGNAVTVDPANATSPSEESLHKDKGH